MGKKILICTPNLKNQGGVANYYGVARKYFDTNVKYVDVSPYNRFKIAKIISYPFVILKAVFQIILFRSHTVVLNPSLGRVALLRDAFILFLCSFLGKRCVVFWHGWNPQQEYILKRFPFSLCFRILCKTPSKHIVLNRYLYALIKLRGISEDNIFMTSTLVDNSYFTKVSKCTERDRKKLVILFLTRIEKYKGIYEAIDIVERLNPQLVQFHVVGDGSELSNVKDEVSKRKMTNVKFYGYLDGREKLEVFQNSDIYLFPSYSEGMPNSLLEAMSFGLSLVCSNVGALGDFFQNEKMGFCLEMPINIEEFIKALERLIDDSKLRFDISNHNREFAKTNFRASEVVHKLVQNLL